jgi:energy-coupling factor transport system substrate-specific component
MVTVTAAPSTGPRPAARHRVLRIRPRAAIALTIASLGALVMFCWPLVLDPPDGFAHRTDAPFVFIGVLPALIAIVLAELSDRGIDGKTMAMLGVLSAVGAALRPIGAGTAGVETVFFMLVLAGRVYGPGFGYVLGSTTLFGSALLTGGVGPWLPFQMMAASWVGLGAGFLPRARGRAEIVLLATYGAISAYAYGFLMNLWYWPFAIGEDTQLSYVPGGSVLENLHRFFLYTVTTSSFGWDTGRAVTNGVAILVLGPAVLAVLRRGARRAAFDAPVSFAEAR